MLVIEETNWMASEVPYQLLFPIVSRLKSSSGEIREESLTELILRRPKARDIEAIDSFKGGDVARTLFAVAKLSGLASHQVDQLDAADLGRVSEIIAGFQPPGLPTGETFSEI